MHGDKIHMQLPPWVELMIYGYSGADGNAVVKIKPHQTPFKTSSRSDVFINFPAWGGFVREVNPGPRDHTDRRSWQGFERSRLSCYV